MVYETLQSAQAMANWLNSRKGHWPVKVQPCDKFAQIGFTSVHKFWTVVVT